MVEMTDHTQGKWKERPFAAPSISHSSETWPRRLAGAAGAGSRRTGGCGGGCHQAGLPRDCTPGPTSSEAEDTPIPHPGTHELRGRGHPDSTPRSIPRDPRAQRQRTPRFHTLGTVCTEAEDTPIPHLRTHMLRGRGHPDSTPRDPQAQRQRTP